MPYAAEPRPSEHPAPHRRATCTERGTKATPPACGAGTATGRIFLASAVAAASCSSALLPVAVLVGLAVAPSSARAAAAAAAAGTRRPAFAVAFVPVTSVGAGTGAGTYRCSGGDGGATTGDVVPTPRAAAAALRMSGGDGEATDEAWAASLFAQREGEDVGDEYSRCLYTPRQERDQIRKETGTYAIVDSRPKWRSELLGPLGRWRRKLFPDRVPPPGTLILVRGGESVWNKNHTFTGWADPDLTPEGVLEMEHAGRILLENGYEPDVVYTSCLTRAIHSAWVTLQEINGAYLPVFKSWRLNERMYGAVTGLSKRETAQRFGTRVVQSWRNSLKARPPPVRVGDAYHPGRDRRYADLTPDQLPSSESMRDCMERTRPLWEYKIRRELRRGSTVLVVAHGNTLRGLMKIVDDVADQDIVNVNIPMGIPYVYKFDVEMNPLPLSSSSSSSSSSDGDLTEVHTSGMFLEKPGLLKEALKREEERQMPVPGYKEAAGGGGGIDDTSRATTKRVTTLEKSLLKLREEREIAGWEKHLAVGAVPTQNGGAEPEFEGFEEIPVAPRDEDAVVNTNVEALPADAGLRSGVQEDPVVVLIRHGRTPHNKLALFTGWEDPPLAEEGVEDAKEAGRLLRQHGYEFDVCYSSWLTRAIETAWHVMDELDCQWIPIIKSWRLNERMYGALTGKSKKMVANIHGEEQLKKWRRGFKTRPPPVSVYSFSYPGNDYRRTRYVKDIRVSIRETIFRSLEARKLQIHRKFPRSESLHDCMGRSIPFYTQRIVPEAVEKGKRVLITSHENAIRGVLMHLCEIPEEHMNELHIPNGLPLIYNVKRKCISLLDDGTGRDPLEVHNFGPGAKYLFRPCLLEEDDLSSPPEEVVATQIEQSMVTNVSPHEKAVTAPSTGHHSTAAATATETATATATADSAATVVEKDFTRSIETTGDEGKEASAASEEEVAIFHNVQHTVNAEGDTTLSTEEVI